MLLRLSSKYSDRRFDKILYRVISCMGRCILISYMYVCVCVCVSIIAFETDKVCFFAFYRALLNFFWIRDVFHYIYIYIIILFCIQWSLLNPDNTVGLD